MSFRLVSVSIAPRAPGGLELPELAFGEFLTHVHGENGSGKTAVMCSIYWALGGSRQPEEPLWTECEGVKLNLIASTGQTVSLFRTFSDHMTASITIDGDTTECDDEAEWADAVLPLLGIEPRTWSGKNGGTTRAYLSVVLPAFAIDQDKGWQLPYAPFSTKQFVEDQSQEVTRLMLGLPTLHDPQRDLVRNRLVHEVSKLDAALEMRGQAIDSLAKSLPPEHQMLDGMREVRERLLGELKQFDSVVSSLAEADGTLRQIFIGATEVRDAAARELSSARQRRAVLENLMREGNADLDLVGTNEVAADAFRRFCGNPSCQFFAGSSQPNSYGRRVLFLRDQFKDIAKAMDAVEGVLAVGATRLAAAEADLNKARAEYEAAVKARASDRVVAAVDAVTRELAAVSRNIALSEQVHHERATFDELTSRREEAFTNLTNHDKAEASRRKSVTAVAKQLGAAIVRWLTVLGGNAAETFGVDDDLRLTVRGKIVNDTRGPSGSSRGRLILAYHAALLEVALEVGGHHPPVLLFDAPKQHELNPDHFDAYLAELRRVFLEKSVQVVISARTEIHLKKGDLSWEPTFPGVSHAWYLGRPPALQPVP